MPPKKRVNNPSESESATESESDNVQSASENDYSSMTSGSSSEGSSSDDESEPKTPALGNKSRQSNISHEEPAQKSETKTPDTPDTPEKDKKPPVNVFEGLRQVADESEKTLKEESPEGKRTAKQRLEEERKARAEAKQLEKLRKDIERKAAADRKAAEKATAAILKAAQKETPKSAPKRAGNKGGAKTIGNSAGFEPSMSVSTDPSDPLFAGFDPKAEEKDFQARQALIFKIQKYGNSKRLGEYLKKECKFKYDDAFLRKLTLKELQFEYAKQDTALSSRSNETLANAAIKNGALMLENTISSKTAFKIKGTVEKCWLDDHFLDLVERIKIKYSMSPLEKMDPIVECSFILLQTAFMMHKQNSLMEGGKTNLNQPIDPDAL